MEEVALEIVGKVGEADSGFGALEGAVRVQVRVEKLDRVPGAALGVEITRLRPAAGDGNVVPLTPPGSDG